MTDRPIPRRVPAMLLAFSLALAASQSASALELDCVIEPHIVVDLGSRAVGILSRVHVDLGDRVAANQIVAELDSGVEEKELAVAKARSTRSAEIRSRQVSHAYEKSRRNRLDTLYASNAVPQMDRDRAAADADLARASLDEAREARRLAFLELERAGERLALLQIRSPITGVVVARHLDPGERVDEQPLMTLAQLDPLRVEVIVPLAHFEQIRAGVMATVYPEAPMGGEYASQVVSTAPVIDAASGTFRARLALANPDLAIPSGLRCRVQFALEAPAPERMPVKAPGSTFEPTIALSASRDTLGDPDRRQPNSDALGVAVLPGPPVPQMVRPVPAHFAPAEMPFDVHAAVTGPGPPRLPAGEAERVPPSANDESATHRSAGSADRSQASPAEELADSTAAKPVPAREPVRAEVAGISDANDAAQPLQCWRIGPLEDPKLVERLSNAVGSQARSIAVRTEAAGAPIGYLVLSSPGLTRQETKALGQKLRDQGFTDMLRLGRGPWRGRMSMGYFAKLHQAETRAALIQGFGVEAQIELRYSSPPASWVAVWITDDVHGARTVAEAARAVAPDAAVEASDCDGRTFAHHDPERHQSGR